MKPSAEIEAKGLTAYEQARAFERLRSWRLPVTYCLAPLLPLLLGLAGWRLGHPVLFGAGVIFAMVMAVRGWTEWKRLKARHEANRRLLAELENTYGEDLPWLQMERHFAELEKLKREMAAEKESAAG
jgi:hypothetical protein